MTSNDLCRHCGKCCLIKSVNKIGQIVYTNKKCTFLTEDNLCSVYENRPSWCVTVERAKKEGIFRLIYPEDCAYRQEDLKLVFDN